MTVAFGCPRYTRHYLLDWGVLQPGYRFEGISGAPSSPIDLPPPWDVMSWCGATLRNKTAPHVPSLVAASTTCPPWSRLSNVVALYTALVSGESGPGTGDAVDASGYASTFAGGSAHLDVTMDSDVSFGDADGDERMGHAGSRIIVGDHAAASGAFSFASDTSNPRLGAMGRTAGAGVGASASAGAGTGALAAAAAAAAAAESAAGSASMSQDDVSRQSPLSSSSSFVTARQSRRVSMSMSSHQNSHRARASVGAVTTSGTAADHAVVLKLLELETSQHRHGGGGSGGQGVTGAMLNGPARFLQTLPFAVALPLRDALVRCREVPPPSWPPLAYALVGRSDLAVLTSGGDHVAQVMRVANGRNVHAHASAGGVAESGGVSDADDVDGFRAVQVHSHSHCHAHAHSRL